MGLDTPATKRVRWLWAGWLVPLAGAGGVVLRSSREARELLEVVVLRRALFEERVAALFAFLTHVEEHRGVVGELGNAGHAVEFGVEGCLEQSQRYGAVLQHFARPGDALIFELSERHDFVDQAHVQRFLGAVLAAEVPDLTRLLLSNQPCELDRTKATIEAAHARAGLPKASIVGGDCEVTDHVQHVATADRVAGYEGDDRLGHRPDELMEVDNVEPRNVVLADITTVAAHALVAAGAERAAALPGEQDHADFGVLPRSRECVQELEQRLRPEGVVDLRAVDAD